MLEFVLVLAVVGFFMWAAPRVVPAAGAPIPQIAIALLTIICLVLWHWHGRF